MRGVFTYLFAITALFTHSACGKLSPEEIRRQDPHPTSLPRIQVSAVAIEGDWQSDCAVEHAENGLYLKTYYSFQQGAVAKQIIIYKDQACQTNVSWERLFAGRYQLNIDTLTQQFYEVKITPRDYPSVVALNLEPYCHAREPFAVNKQSSFNPVNQCNVPQEQSVKVDLRGNDRWGSELFIGDLRLYRIKTPMAPVGPTVEPTIEEAL